MNERVYDCIIIGAGPGGLQASIYLGRYNRDVLIIDRTGGRTWHAKRIKNVLAQHEIPGSEIISRGREQAEQFLVRIERARVVSVQREKEGLFLISTPDTVHRARFVIASSGVNDVLPPIENLHRFLGSGYYTCMDCDGYELTGKSVVVMGDTVQTVNIALAVKRMFTPDITYIPYQFSLPDSALAVLNEENIPVIDGEPVRLFGEGKLEGIELKNGEKVSCEAIMASFGVRLNDEFLSGLGLKRDSVGFKYMVNSVFESSLSGLYIVGPLNTGQDQVVIAAGEGATAAIDINKKLLAEQETREGVKAEVCRL
jgi:thioredoxin reductase (NADPH)